MFRLHMKPEPPHDYRSSFATAEETRMIKVLLDHAFDHGIMLINTGSGSIGRLNAIHGPFAAGADKNLAQPELERLVITDTIPPFRLHSEATRAKLKILSVAPLFGEAIERIHSGGSIVDLLAV